MRIHYVLASQAMVTPRPPTKATMRAWQLTILTTRDLR
jgi:hypothetical protein